MTNNEKMIELYGRNNTGYCADCKHISNKNKCGIGRIEINPHMSACGKYEVAADD